MDGGYNFDEQGARRIVETVRWAEGFPRTREPLPFEVPSNTGGGWFACKNQASAAIPPYGLARVVDMTTMPNDPRPMILVDQPSTTFSRLYVVAHPQGIAANGYGACSLGPMADFLYSGSPSNGDGYGPQASSWAAAKNYPSCLTVIGIVNSTSTIARGRLSPINTVIGKLAGDLAANDHATVNIYGGAGGSEAIISSLTLDGREWVGASLKSGAAVRCEWINGLWYIETAETSGSIWGTLAATISGDPTSCNVSKYINCKNPGSTVNVYQPYSSAFTGNSGARYRATYSVDDAKWYFDWVDECH